MEERNTYECNREWKWRRKSRSDGDLQNEEGIGVLVIDTVGEERTEREVVKEWWVASFSSETTPLPSNGVVLQIFLILKKLKNLKRAFSLTF